MLFVSTQTAEPFSASLIDPKTGAYVWKFRGTELQGGTNGNCEILGT
jgi:hypothetical protein